MNLLNNYDKNTIKKFIKQNELDYTIVDNNLSKFHVISESGIEFFFYDFNSHYLISVYDFNYDNEDTIEEPYTYMKMESIDSITNILKIYDNTLLKKYWELTSNSIEIGFDKENYDENWYKDFIDENWEIVSEDDYDILVYENTDIKPSVENPFYSLDSVSDIYAKKDNIIDKLYIEVHPITCIKGNEEYLLKLLRNDDPIFKEYNNYIVQKKKGLKLLINQIFDEYN